MRLLGLVVFCAYCSALTAAAPARIAVAANFAKAANDLAALFEQHGHQPVQMSIGSTGKLFAQIQAGAPFDAFFAADIERPQALVNQGLASRLHVYARGQLALWSAETVKPKDLLAQLARGKGRLAIAKPALAPYGAAAQDYLQRQGLWQLWQSQIIYGHSIGQVFQFTHSRNAQLGLCAAAQLVKQSGTAYILPLEDYKPILQAAVLLSSNSVALEFLTFVCEHKAARDYLHNHGFLTPEEPNP